MTRLRYEEAELLREHDYARPHQEAGRTLHGGFDADGCYVSPRTAVRWDAVDAWTDALAERGLPRVPADRSLLVAGAYPTHPQMKLLLKNGLGQSLWNTLTITGVIEGRGRALIDLPAPDFGDVVLEDVSGLAVGHLARGLLKAHGLDEGGDPASGVGGHDAMWFAVRDLLFGPDAHPMPEIPPRIGREETGRVLPLLPEAHEGMVLLLMNLLMIEVRAERVFDFVESLLSDPELFTDRREAAGRAVALVRRIRTDEEIHVAYLRTVISELRGLTFLAGQGAQVPGREFLDPLWQDLVHWHAVALPRQSRDQQRRVIHQRIRDHFDDASEGEAVLAAYQALEPDTSWARRA